MDSHDVIAGENNQYLIRNRNRRVPANSQEKVTLKVFYKDKLVPKVIGLSLNNKVICDSCSFMFQYDPYDPSSGLNDQWSGILTLKSGIDSGTFSSSIAFDKPPLEVTVSNNVLFVNLFEIIPKIFFKSDYEDPIQVNDVEYLIQKSAKIAAGNPVKLKLTVKYQNTSRSKVIPTITGIKLEDQQCLGQVDKPPQLLDELVSPCPQIFEYESVDKKVGKWYGKMSVNFKRIITDPNITIVLDGPSLQLGVRIILF